jgi:uncharacterized protein YndB with AHSA1/START domain
MIISDKQLIKTCIHTITNEEAYDYFTTHDGLKSFFGEDNAIEITPGGKYEIYFMMDQPYGQRGAEGCKVLSFIPNRMLSFTWNAPPQYPQIRNSDYHTWVVLEFFDQRIRLTHLGWPEDESWTPVFDYFDRAWTIVLDNFCKIGNCSG